MTQLKIPPLYLPTPKYLISCSLALFMDSHLCLSKLEEARVQDWLCSSSLDKQIVGAPRSLCYTVQYALVA